MNINFQDLISHIFDGLYLVDKDRRIIYWNKPAELITGYSQEEVVGHACRENILVHVDKDGKSLCRRGCPMAATIVDGQPRDAHIYLHHKDGHRVPVWIRATQLRDPDGNVIGGAELFSDLSADNAISDKIEELQKLSLIDDLTQLANRRYVESELEGRFSEKQRYGLNFGLMLLDIDFFKKVNDTHGHDIGDRVLKTVSNTIMHMARPYDLYGRWGGEEFMGIIRNVDGKGLLAISERIRSMIAKSFIQVDAKNINVTVSIGAATANDQDTLASLVKRADELLYRSKEGGRNLSTLG